MKRSYLICIIFILLLLGACDNSDSNTNNEDGSITISYQANVTPNLTKEYWEEQISRFEDEHEGIDVELLFPAGGDTGEFVQERLAADDIPDVMTNVVKNVPKDEVLMDIPIDDEIKQMENWDQGLTDDKLYSVFPYVQPASLIFYNKDLFEKAEITEIPETQSELIEVSKKFKEQDITPLLTSGDWVTKDWLKNWAFKVFDGNPDWYADRYEDSVSFTDPEWIEVGNILQEMAEEEYIGEGALSLGYEQLQQAFLNGEFAMYPMGSFFSADAENADFEIGVFPVPSQEKGDKPLLFANMGAGAGGYSIAKETDHPDEALELVHFLSFDKESHKIYAEADGLFSDLEDPVTYDMTSLQEEIFDLTQKSELLNNQIAGEDPVAGLDAQYEEAAQNIILGEDVEEEMEKLDEYWDDNADK